MKAKEIKERQNILESEGKFDVDMQEVHRTKDALSIDNDYNYLITKKSEKFRRGWLLTIVQSVGTLITFFGLGSYVVGKKNLRALKGQGAVSICNHVHPLDTLCLKVSLGSWRVFHTGAYYLIKRGWCGRIFKSGGFLPVGSRLTDIKRLQDAVGTLVHQGKIVNMYPEQALWPRYENIRPFKTGAFHFAVKFNVPILPVFIEFRQTKLRKFFHLKKKVIIHILPALYPPEGENMHERELKMCEQAHTIMCEYGEQLYGRSVDAEALAEHPSDISEESVGK